jgi:murein DD-endopeptidase MepM/ murein hydrolase activator NlpD
MRPMNNKFLIFILLIPIILFGLRANVSAVTSTEIKNQINNINEQIADLDKEIAKYQEQLNETGQQKNTLNNKINELTITRNKLLTEKNKIQKKIDQTDIVINDIVNNINNNEEVIIKSEASLKKMLYSLYQVDKKSFIELLLSEDKLTEFSKEYNNTLTINKKVREYIKELSNEKIQLADSKVKKQEEQNKLNNLKKTLLAQETAVLNTKKETTTILTQTKNKEAEYQKLLAEAEKRKNDFEKEMDDYENQLKLLINPKLLPKEGSEVLAWPLDSILVTSKYGARVNPFNSSIKSFHYGVDFRAPVGTSVKSVESGIVVDTGNTDIACKGASFGNWVLVKHNNGLSSTYAHLSVISVKKGQVLKEGDIIGLSGGMKSVFGSGSSTGPHLHLSVYASDGVGIASFESKACPGKILTQPRITRADAHLNPLLYLPQITTSMVKK